MNSISSGATARPPLQIHEIDYEHLLDNIDRFALREAGEQLFIGGGVFTLQNVGLTNSRRHDGGADDTTLDCDLLRRRSTILIPL